MALEDLVSRGHDFDKLWDGYPAVMVKGLLAAARTNRRRRQQEQVLAFTVAVTGALDLAFNGGRGQVLDKWLAAADGPPAAPPPPDNRDAMTDRAFALFTSLPVKTVKRQHNGK